MDSSMCLHCKRNIPSSSLDLHTAHCARFIQLCPKCEEPIAISEFEKHINEYHCLHFCEICNFKVEGNDEWRKHQVQNCSKQNFLPCEFCEMECLSTNINEHKTACGSRSEMCNICNIYILKRVLKAHMELHIHPPVDSSPHHALPFTKMGKKHQPIFNPPPLLNVNNTPEPARFENENTTLIPCEFCQVGYAVEILEEHQLLCGTVFETCSRCHKKLTRNQRALHFCFETADDKQDTEDDNYWSKYSAVASGGGDETNQDENDSIPCEICGTRFPFSCLELHEIACKFSTMSKIEEEFNGKQNYEKLLTAEAHQIPSPSICELCNTYVPLEILQIHQARCMHFQNERRSSKPVVKRNEDRHEKKSVKVDRYESSVQRAVREKVLLAASNRETTNPKIPQSKMKIVVLPDGQQILKKANPSSEHGGFVDVGHKLGRGESTDNQHQYSNAK